MVQTGRNSKGRRLLAVMSLICVFSAAATSVQAFEGILSAGIMTQGGDTRGYLYSHMFVGQSFMVGLEFNPREYSFAALLGRRSGFYSRVGWETDGSVVPKYTDVGIWGRTLFAESFTTTGFAAVNRTTATGKYDLKLGVEVVAPISDYVYFLGGAETGIVTSPDSTKGWLGVGLAF